jgi:NAD(P)-dependent dehydrogenase (short-subunit alcohol dehydrogenase family)
VSTVKLDPAGIDYFTDAAVAADPAPHFDYMLAHHPVPSVQRKRDVGTMPSAQDMARHIPVGRMGTGEDIAAAVAYLVSDDACYVTGQTVSVNGGAFIG